MPIERTIKTIEVDEGQISREYTMEGRVFRDPDFLELHYSIMEMFPRGVFGGFDS